MQKVLFCYTYLLRGAVLLEKLTGLQLVKKLPAFHGTRRFITALTSVHHLSLSWASPTQSIYIHPMSWRSVLILSAHLRLGLPSGLLPSGFPTKTLYTPLSSPIRAICPAHLILLDIITRTILGEEYKFCNKFIIFLYMFRALCVHHQEINVLYSIWYHHICRWPSGVYRLREEFSPNLCTPDGHLHV